jgi:hypothetical protein
MYAHTICFKIRSKIRRLASADRTMGTLPFFHLRSWNKSIRIIYYNSYIPAVPSRETRPDRSPFRPRSGRSRTFRIRRVREEGLSSAEIYLPDSSWGSTPDGLNVVVIHPRPEVHRTFGRRPSKPQWACLRRVTELSGTGSCRINAFRDGHLSNVMQSPSRGEQADS